MNPAAHPNLQLVAHEMDPDFPDESWYGVKFNSPDLLELTRTPGYHTWQGERWLFCCEKPCIFIGSILQVDLERLAHSKNTTAEELLAEMLSLPLADVAEFLPLTDGGTVVYAFRCSRCDKLRAHWDCD